MTAFKPGSVFDCCLWAHLAPAPGSSVEQGQINETKDKYFWVGDFLDRKCLYDRNYGGKAVKAEHNTAISCTAAILVSWKKAVKERNA